MSKELTFENGEVRDADVEDKETDEGTDAEDNSS